MIKKNKVLVSVILSVYNEEKYLDKSIESILSQTFKDFEFIIIDDASKDNSLSIIKRYQKNDTRIKLISNKKNIGLTKSLNKGIKIAQGKYIARQDSDDISLPARLEKQYNFLEKNENIFLCGTNFKYINDKNQLLKSDCKLLYNFRSIKNRLPIENCFVHTSIMFRNKGFYYREKMNIVEDYDLYLRLLSLDKKMVNLPYFLVKYRIHPNSISTIKNNKQKLFVKKAKQFYNQRLKKGKDEYDTFNPGTVLKKKYHFDNRNIFWEKEIKLLLKGRDYNKVKEYLQKHKDLNGQTSMKYIFYYICSSYPLIYKLYRKIFYYNKT